MPGKKAGDRAVFGGLFGESPIMKIANGTSEEAVPEPSSVLALLFGLGGAAGWIRRGKRGRP